MELFSAGILHLYNDSQSNCDFSETIQTTNYKKQTETFQKKIPHSFVQMEILFIDEKH